MLLSFGVAVCEVSLFVRDMGIVGGDAVGWGGQVSRGEDMWCVMRYVMWCVCRVALCRPSGFPWYVGTVVGGGVVLCAEPCLMLEWCRCAVGFVVRGAYPLRVAWVRDRCFAELLE